MRRDELIIDGTSVDLADAQIALTYTNNILSDIDKISASHSYTITLPLTRRNERVFDYVTSVSHVSSKVGVYLDAEYRRNGIAITRGAKAYVTKISESGIEVCLLWDGLAKLSAWLKEDHTLNELVFPDYYWLGTPSDYYDYYNDVVEAEYETGVAASKMPPTPVVNLYGLLSWVMSESLALDWSIDVNGMKEEMQKLFLPLCSRGGTRAQSLGGVYTYITVGNGINAYAKASGKLVFSNGTCDVSNFSKVILSFNVSARTAQMNTTATPLTVAINDDAGNNATYTATQSGDVWTFAQTIEWDCADATELRIYFRGLKNVAAGQKLTGGFTVTPYNKEAVLGDLYDVGGNLPEVKMVDFIKTVCTLFGAQVINTQSGGLKFVSVDTVYTNLYVNRKWLDWTDKVINYKRVPKSADFGVGSYAQANWLRYADADTDAEGVNADGAFYVTNETLESEQDMSTIIFAPSKASTIVQYQLNDDSTVEDVEVTPRIMRGYETSDGTLGLEFAQSLYMSSIIERWYSGLKRMLEYPVEMTVYARLTEKDLAELDWTIPVYLKQTGKYYIVKEIKTDSDGEISELTLYQL